MMTAGEIILQIVFPTLGIFTGTFMSFAPYRAVLKASRTGHLGDLNPTPWVFMLGNCCGWITYSFLIHNWFIFLTNASGFILAIWLNIQAIKIKYENHRTHDLRENIIAALEDKSQRMLNRKEVAKLFDKVVAEEYAEVIDPSSTMPMEEIFLDKADPTKDNKNTYEELSDSENEDNDDNDDNDNPPGITGAILENEAITMVWEITAQRSPAPVSHELMVVGISAFWLLLITIVALGSTFINQSARVLLIGLVVNINLIFFYGAPLSKIVEVLKTKSSKLLHVPTMICSTANGTLWLVYGKWC